MAWFKQYLQNSRFPADTLGGKVMLFGMNMGHYPLYRYALSLVPMTGRESVLDIGCGGGRFLKLLLKRTLGRVMGIDYSPKSVEKSIQINEDAVARGRLKILQADVSAIPARDGLFDLVSAIETIYFWPDIEDSLTEVLRVMKPGGRFVIANEIRSVDAGKKWSDLVEMNIYEPEPLRALLEAAGFVDVEVHLHWNQNYMAAVAKKA